MNAVTNSAKKRRGQGPERCAIAYRRFNDTGATLPLSAMKKDDPSPRNPLAVSCPTCGAGAGREVSAYQAVNRAGNPIEIAVYLQKTRAFTNPRSPRRLKRPVLRTGADAYQGCTFLSHGWSSLLILNGELSSLFCHV